MSTNEATWNHMMIGRNPKPQEMFLNVDLIGTISVYLRQLTSWKTFISTETNETFIRKAIRRYERLWLTLLNQLTCDSDVGLQPPSDIYWIWHLHMLQPSNYSIYCKQRFGRVLYHRFHRTETESLVFKSKTATAWHKAYPNEPFELEDLESENLSILSTPPSTRLDHLVDVAQREKRFLHRIELPQFQDQSFLFSAVTRYRQLLALKQVYDWDPRCLPVDLELVWRVHMLHPLLYMEDIKRVFNPNKNSVSILSTQSFLASGINCLEHLSAADLLSFISVSNRFWSSVYPDEDYSFYSDGTVPRPLLTGKKTNNLTTRQDRLRFFQTTESSLVAFNSDCYESHSVESCSIVFTGICVEDLKAKQKTFKILANVLGMNSFKQVPIFQVKGLTGHVVTKSDKKYKVQNKDDVECLGRCRFDPKENRGIELQIFACRSFVCFHKYQLVATKIFDPLQNLLPASQNKACLTFNNASLTTAMKNISMSCDNISKKQKLEIPKVTYTDPKVTLYYEVDICNRKPFQFVLDRNPGELTELPTYLKEHLAEVITWQKRSLDSEKSFAVARHSLKCRDAGLAFGIEIVRDDSDSLLAASLFHNNQHLVAIAYSIGSHYLPNPSQVMETCPVTLDSQIGDLSMVITNHLREEQIITSKWVEGHANESRIVIKTYNMKTQQISTTEISEDEQQSFSSPTTSVDLPSGRISVSSSADKIPENLLWAFCVGCMYISMQRCGNSSLFSSQSILGLNVRCGDGSVRSSAGQMSSDTSTDISSIGKKSKKKLSLQKYRQNRRLSKRRKMSASFTFLLACGFRVDAAPTVTDFNGNESTKFRPHSSVRDDVGSLPGGSWRNEEAACFSAPVDYNRNLLQFRRSESSKEFLHNIDSIFERL